MTKEQFCGLPLPLALGLIYDACPTLAPVEAPSVPSPPKFDGKIPRKGGMFTWMSEMLLADLQWWEAKKRESAASGGQYSERDGKDAKSIARWVAYRQVCPTDSWSGERDRVKVRAQTPSRDPELHDWKRAGEPAPSQGASYSDADYASKDDTDPLPF